MKSKKLSSKAAITIPKDIRLDAGFVGGMAVDIEKTPDGILIKPHRPTCRFCGSIESVQTIMGMEMCSECAAKLLKEVSEKYAG